MSENPIAHTVEMWTELVHNMAGEATKELGLLFGEKVRAYRLRNVVDATVMARQMLSDAGIPEKPVPPRLLLPIIENCSVENDPDLQKMWAGLLASASDEGDTVSPSFIETLRQLTPDEAKNLNTAFEQLEQLAAGNEFPHNPQLWRDIPIGYTETYERLGLIQRKYHVSTTAKPSRRRRQQVKLPVRIGPDSKMPSWLPPSMTVRAAMERNEELPELDSRTSYVLQQTGYFTRFMRACRGPRSASK